LGPIYGLSARQLNSCLPRREEKRREEKRREEKRRRKKGPLICGFNVSIKG